MPSLPHWQEYHDNFPQPWGTWLGVPGSLTGALQKRGGEPCQLQVQREDYAFPWSDECEFLELASNEKHWVREITLSQKLPLVYARSIFPQALIAHHPQFTQLGGGVLAEVLFNDPHIYRGDIEVAKLHSEHVLFTHIASVGLVGKDQSLWARRSRFHIKNHQLMVCEVFLDAITDL